MYIFIQLNAHCDHCLWVMQFRFSVMYWTWFELIIGYPLAVKMMFVNEGLCLCFRTFMLAPASTYNLMLYSRTRWSFQFASSVCGRSKETFSCEKQEEIQFISRQLWIKTRANKRNPYSRRFRIHNLLNVKWSCSNLLTKYWNVKFVRGVFVGFGEVTKRENTWTICYELPSPLV